MVPGKLRVLRPNSSSLITVITAPQFCALPLSLRTAYHRQMALHFLCIWRSQWHDKGSDQNIFLDIQQGTALQRAGQAVAIPEILVQAPREQRQRNCRPPVRRRRQTLCKTHRERSGNDRSAQEIRPRRAPPADLWSPRRLQCTPRRLQPKHGSSSADARRVSRSQIFARRP
jgi:hypothetical protein